MIENALVAVTAMYQLTKQQTGLSVTLASNSLWITSHVINMDGVNYCPGSRSNILFLKDEDKERQWLILQTHFSRLKYYYGVHKSYCFKQNNIFSQIWVNNTESFKKRTWLKGQPIYSLIPSWTASETKIAWRVMPAR